MKTPIRLYRPYSRAAEPPADHHEIGMAEATDGEWVHLSDLTRVLAILRRLYDYSPSAVYAGRHVDQYERALLDAIDVLREMRQ